MCLCQLSHDQNNHDRDRQSCKTSSTEKNICLLAPAVESGAGVRSDRYKSRKMGDPVRGQQAILAPDFADEANCTAIVLAQSGEGRLEGFPDEGLGLRKPR